MRKLFIFCLFIFSSSFLTARTNTKNSYFDFLFSNSKDEIPEPNKLMGDVLDEVISILSKKYGVYPIGIGMGGQFKRISLELEVQKILSKDEIRSFLILAENLLLDKINSNVDLKPYLNDFPFTNQNASVNLFIKDKKFNRVYYPNVSVASIGSVGLQYKTKDSEKKFGYKSQEYETFEEAIAKVEKYQAQKLTVSNSTP